MEKKIDSKKIIITIVLLAIALLSIFVISKVASSAEFHAKTIKSLDDKKITVMELTAATAGTATAIAAIPSDATTPLANQIMQLSSYLLIIVGAIFLEKILLTLTGYITFTFLIPISCLLFGIYLYFSKDILKNLAIKLAIFGIVIFLTVPISVQISDLIEATHETTINQTIEDAKDLGNQVEENTEVEDKQEGVWNTITSTVTGAVSSIGNGVSKIIEKGKTALSNFIDAIATLLITTCVIPIAVLIFIMWIIKIIFGINIPIKDVKKIKPNDKEPKVISKVDENN